MNIDKELLDLEKRYNHLFEIAFGKTGKWEVPGTNIARVFKKGEGQGVEWSLGIGCLGDPKEFFNSDTIEDCIEQAKKYLSLEEARIKILVGMGSIIKPNKKRKK